VIRTLSWGATALALLGGTTCGRPDRSAPAISDTAALAQREARVEAALASDSSQEGNGAVARWILPRNLREISGLALTPDDRLFAHGDERARIVEVDYRKGVVIKQFGLGRPELRGDFEGIAAVGDALYLLASNGVLYQFKEGKDGEAVPYTEFDTRLGQECEFEGLAYASAAESLLLACKNVAIKGLKRSLVIFQVKLDPKAPERITRLALPVDEVVGSNPWKQLSPSDITVDPATGNYVVITAQESALVVLTPAGKPVSARRIPGRHPQAEGVAITRDGVLLVSDEAPRGGGDAVLSLYKWP
jgi:uncharacterized protein YjiK